MSEGDLSSWIVAGSFVSKREGMHSYDLGLSYSTQEYQGGNPLALAAVSDGNRNVGEVYAIDRWTVGPGVTFEYGGRYARYDYLATAGRVQPARRRDARTLEAHSRHRRAGAAHDRAGRGGVSRAGRRRSVAAARAYVLAADGNDLRVERARYLDVLFEHDFGRTYLVGVRRFFQGVDNQVMTIFGDACPSGVRSVGHYYVATAGAVDAQGWGVRLSTSALAAPQRIG